ncbi:MAG: type IX secretion system protein PorQ [Bacteroidia bacterium]
MKKHLLIVLLLPVWVRSQVVPSTSQNFGPTTYRFLDLPMPARAAALGGTTMSIWGDDINLSYSNPALLNASSANQLAMNYSKYVSDMNYGNVAYAKHINNVGTISAGIQYFNYGKFDKRDEYDVSSGTFRAADYALNLSMARRLKDTSFSIGGTIKTIYSHYDIYSSVGNALDLGFTYHNKKDLTVSLVAKNIGKIWKAYNKGSANEFIHYDVQLGISYKVKKAPFRLSLVYDQLTKWDLTYVSSLSDTATTDPFSTGQAAPVKTDGQKFKDKLKTDFDKLGRHLIVATEIVLTKNFNLRIGYNYRQHKEMMLPDKRTGSGVSFGFGFGINRFRINYAFSKYNVAGNSNIFSVTSYIGPYTVVKKKKLKEAKETAQ